MNGEKKEKAIKFLKKNGLTLGTFLGVLIGKFSALQVLFGFKSLLLRHRPWIGTEGRQGHLEPEAGHVRGVHRESLPQHVEGHHHPSGGSFPHRRHW